MKKLFPLAVLLSASLFTGGCGSPTVLTIAGGSVGQELEFTVAGAERFMKRNPNIRVNVLPVPASATERLGNYLQILEGESDSVDVYMIDVVWPGILAEHALDLSDYFSSRELSKYFQQNLESNTVDGKLVAMPLVVGLAKLFYRSDLLKKYGYQKPPATWEELEEMATKIQAGERDAGNDDFWGFIFQGAAYEGLTCNALEWQVSNGGLGILNPDGEPILNNDESIEAFTKASSWIASISPPDVISFDEDETGVVWRAGNAAFMRNWAQAYAGFRDMESLAGKFNVTSLPAGNTGSAATLGGWELMVSRYSKHPKQAVELVRFLAGEREQRRRAIDGANAPTIASLYKDPDVLTAVPFLVGVERLLESAVLRPSAIAGSRYDHISRIYYSAVHDILNGSDAHSRLDRAAVQMQEVMAQ